MARPPTVCQGEEEVEEVQEEVQEEVHEEEDDSTLVASSFFSTLSTPGAEADTPLVTASFSRAWPERKLLSGKKKS